jgi:ankyrin repeat protein
LIIQVVAKSVLVERTQVPCFFSQETVHLTPSAATLTFDQQLSIDGRERMNSIDRELFEAVGENFLSEVRRLVSVGADVNTKDNHGWTPLHRASHYGHVQVFHALREHGSDIDAKNNDGLTPLHVACYTGHVHIVKEMREHGGDIDAKDIHGFMPLHLACDQGHLAVVYELVSPNDGNGTPPILGKRKSRGGADIDARDNNGNTPLHITSWRGNLAVVKALLRGGADILAVNELGLLPIHQAVSERKSAVSKYLLQSYYATITRRLPLHELLEDLTWIGKLNSSDVPPLRAALDQDVLRTDDVVEILEYLVGQNPELISSRDQDGSFPLHVACRRGASFSIVQSLVNLYKASVKCVTPQGDLPLFLACEIPEPSLDTIFLLMKLYPDLVYR